MNMRAETSLLGSSSSFGPGNNKADNTTENQLVQGLKNNPQQKYDPFARGNEEFWRNEDKNYKNISQIPTDEEIRRAKQEVEQGYAASREDFNSSQKQAQMNSMWNKYEINNQKADVREKKVVSEYLSTERTNSDDQMREALARFKAEQERITGPEKQAQMESDWGQYEVGNKIALQKKEERAEQRSSPNSTSSFALTSQFSSGPQGLASQEKQKQINQVWIENEKGSLLSSQLTRTQEALHLAQKTGDKQLIAILEEQEKNLLESISQNPLTGGISTQEKFDIGKINIERQTAQEKKLNIPDHLVQDVKFVEIQNGQEKNKKTYEPSEDTLAKLHELGVDYNELITISPNFVNLSEGQQAYVLFKAQEQSVEHIQEKADQDFEETRKQSGFLKKMFRSGAMRREANRNAVNGHKGLDAFGEDITRLSNHVSENEWNINIQEDGTYQIEYFKAPEGISAKEKQLFDNYNTTATALSDVPYEWSLPTANKNEQKAYQGALKAFDQTEKVLRKAFEENDKEAPEILAAIFNSRSQIELNQLFTSYPDISSKLNDMKNASFRSDLTKKILSPALIGTSLGAGTRMMSKALYGLGGAAGASFAIGAVMGWRRKNTEFKEDSKAVRRGKELKETGDKVFDSKQNAERIGKLLSKIEKEQQQIENEPNQNRRDEMVKRREKSLLALEDRLQILDDRLKDGRVNFGTAKEQLGNKSLLMEAMTQAHVYRYQLSQEAEPINKRITDYFDTQDKKSKSNRNKARVSAAAMGGLVGAGSATAAWMIADYFKGGETSTKILGALKEGMQEAGDSIKGGLGNLQESMQRGAEEIGQSVRDGWNGAQDNIQSGIDRMVPGQPWFPHGVPGTINPGIETGIPTGPIQNPGFKNFPGIGAGKEAWEAINNIGNATDFEVSVDASSKGAIETFENLQKEIFEKYPDPTQAPQHLQEFLAKSPTQHAIDENFYRPGDPSGNESAKIFKGGKLGFNQAGELVYTDARNGIDMLSGEGKFDGDHFDFGGNQEAKVPSQEFVQGTGSPSPEKLTGEIEHVKLSNKLSVDFEITEDKQGKLQSTFHNIKLDKFDSYHKAYLKQDLDEYSQKIFQSPEFQVEHGEAIRDKTISPETINNDLRNLTNQMIVRDQILQEGGLNPESQEYKILKGERDALRKIIENNFEAYDQKGELLYNVEGKKYPDPNYLFESENSSGIENKGDGSQAAQNVETTAKPKVESVVVRNNVINQDFNFKFEKYPDGKLDTAYIENYKSGNVPNEYFEKRLGFNSDWRKASGLAQTFEDSASGKKLLQNIEIAKVALIGYDSFAPGTPEHELFKNTLNKTIQAIETDYPEVFEYKN